MQFAQLFRADRRRRVGHQVDGLSRFRKRDDLANRVLAAQNRNQPIEAEGDAAVRRRTVLERVEEKPESRLRFFVRDLQQLEDEALQRLVVDSDAAAGDLAAVQHEIVGARARAARIALEERRRRSRAAT